ncbi:MAG: hypothetical protein ACI31M_00635 [Bacilli bacterium]
METNNVQRPQALNLYKLKTSGGMQNVTPIKAYVSGDLYKNRIIRIDTEKEKMVTEPNINPIKEYEVNCVRFCENQIYDDSEIIRSEIADLFNINIPKVSRIYTEQNIPGIIMELHSKKGTQLRTTTDIFSETNSLLQRGVFKKEDYPEYLLEQNNNDNPITDLKTIELIIEKGKKIFASDSFTKDKETKSYIQMILLDLILGQERRNGNGYFVSISLDQQYGRKLEVIPGIFNYDIENRKESLEGHLNEEVYDLNGYIVDRMSLLSVLLTRYSSYIKNIVSPLSSVSSRYKDCISKIIYNNTNEDNALYLESTIFANIDKICMCYNQIPEDANKVELAYTTAQLNLTISQKESEIAEKYPVNPRDNIKEELKKEKTDDDRIKITEGEETLVLKPNGYATAALIGGLISIIAGIGITVAYMILHG